eukprot:g8540.t1
MSLDERISEFSLRYRSSEEDAPLRHFIPLSPDEKDLILALPQVIQASTEESAQGLCASVEKAKKNPQTALFDVCEIFLRYAADQTPEWTEGDRILMRILKSGHQTSDLSIDPDVHTPARAVGALLHYAFSEGWVELDFKESAKEGILFPILTDKLFSPTTLTKHAIQNVFLTGVPKGETKIHGLSVSPLGQMLHDMGHALLCINTKVDAFEKDFSELGQQVPLEGMTYDDQDLFEKITLEFRKEKNKKFESSLLQLFFASDKVHDRAAHAGLFFAIHEIGIHAWPCPSKVGGDLQENLRNFFGGVKTAFEKYYENGLKTSPKDGTPEWDVLPQDIFMERVGVQDALTKVTPHGSILEVQWKTGQLEGREFWTTQKWIVQEAADAQKMLSWALGENHQFALPFPGPDADETVFMAYTGRTLDGILYCLDQASKRVSDLAREENDFYQDIVTVRDKYLEKIKSAFSEKPFFPKLDEIAQKVAKGEN